MFLTFPGCSPLKQYVSMKLKHFFLSIIVVQNLSIPADQGRNAQDYTYHILSFKKWSHHPKKIKHRSTYIKTIHISHIWSFQECFGFALLGSIGIHWFKGPAAWCHAKLLKPTGGSVTLGHLLVPLLSGDRKVLQHDMMTCFGHGKNSRSHQHDYHPRAKSKAICFFYIHFWGIRMTIRNGSCHSRHQRPSSSGGWGNSAIYFMMDEPVLTDDEFGSSYTRVLVEFPFD